MIVCEHEQGTLEWHLDRLGVPSASMFSKIISSTGKASTQAKDYMRQLLADWVANEPVDPMRPTQAMIDGTELEADARVRYEIATGNDVEECGFCFLNEDKLIGMSPDGLVGDDGLLEIKCPKGKTLVGYILDDKLPTAYVQQVQGQLWISGRQWCDFFSYHPKVGHFLHRVERDDEYIDVMDQLTSKFINTMLENRERLCLRRTIV